MEKEIYNPEVIDFKEYLNSTLYIDKTDLIFHLNKLINTKKRYLCLSMPQLFGKSMIADMLTAYYSYSKRKTNIFDEKKIANFNDDINKIKTQNKISDQKITRKGYKYLNEFNVIKLRINEYFKRSIEEGIEEITKTIIREFKIDNPNFNFSNENKIKEIIVDIYYETKRKFIFIIDEWDFVFRFKKEDINFQKDYIEFLLKIISNKKYVALCYMTGVFPIEKYNIDSNLKYIFTECSMTNPKWMAKYIGFNDNEVKELCENQLCNKINNKNSQNISNKKQKLNESYNIIDEENSSINEELIHKNTITYEKIKDYFYGYELFDNSIYKKYKVYSPYFVINSLENNIIETKDTSEFYEFIQNNFENLKDAINSLIETKRIILDSLIYQNDMFSFNKRKNNLIMLVHLGYLSYDNNTDEIFIPNKEIHQIFETLIHSKIWVNSLNKIFEVFNPGEKAFKKELKDIIYVDNTELICCLNKVVDTLNNIVCVSRPRGFGKTITADMLAAYYGYSESRITAFDDKKISKSDNFNKYLGKFNVIKLNMLKYFSNQSIEDGIIEIKKSIINEVQLNGIDFKYNEKDSICKIIQEIRRKTGRKNVIIIDEWDFVLRNKKNDKTAHKLYLEFLTLFIKDEKCIALTYITGILPLKKCNLGNVNEYSMTTPGKMAKYIGFTDFEIKELCEQCKKLNYNNELKDTENENQINNDLLNKKVEVMYKNLKKWYNGYQLNDDLSNQTYEVYAPYSIMQAITNNSIKNYWCESETYEMLQNIIESEYPFHFLKEDICLLMEGKRLKIDIRTYKNDMTSFSQKDDVLTMLIHLGYLGYDSIKKEVFIPNMEVKEGFELSTQNEEWKIMFKKLKKSKMLLDATLKKDEKLVAKLLEEALNQTI